MDEVKKVNLEEIAKILVGLSYNDWQKLQSGVDMAFEKEKREFEKNLKLSSSECVMSFIHSQFG